MIISEDRYITEKSWIKLDGFDYILREFTSEGLGPYMKYVRVRNKGVWQ